MAKFETTEEQTWKIRKPEIYEKGNLNEGCTVDVKM